MKEAVAEVVLPADCVGIAMTGCATTIPASIDDNTSSRAHTRLIPSNNSVLSVTDSDKALPFWVEVDKVFLEVMKYWFGGLLDISRLIHPTFPPLC